MAKAGRPAKVTKHSLLNAISRSFNISQVARDLNVDRHTVYDSAKRYSIDLSTAFKRIPTPADEASWPSVPPVRPEFAEPAPAMAMDVSPKRKPNIIRLTAVDFSGRNFGEAGNSRPDANSYEARYRRLKGY